jgi:hypothetical protein
MLLDDEEHSLCVFVFFPHFFTNTLYSCSADNEIISICKLDQMTDLNTLGMTSYYIYKFNV